MRSPTLYSRSWRVGLFAETKRIWLEQLFPTQVFVAFFYLCGGFRLQAAQDLEKFGRIEGLQLIVGQRTSLETRGRDDDDRNLWLKGLDLLGQLTARYILDAAVEHDSVYSRKSSEDLKGLFAAVRREDVELGGFDHKLASRDASGELPVDDEKTGPVHAKH